MTVSFLAWETDCGVGIDLTDVGDVQAALSMVASWRKRVAWLYITASQLRLNIVEELATIGYIEAIDCGSPLPDDIALAALFRRVIIDYVYVTNEHMRQDVLNVLNQCVPRVHTATHVVIKDDDRRSQRTGN
jgi:hypothetical protein